MPDPVPMTPEQKAWIDAASYEALLRRWRFSPAGDPIFAGESGEYYRARMDALRVAGADHVGASKRIGWEP